MPDISNEPIVPATGDPSSLEERKFELELHRFEFEKSKFRGLGFFNSNFGIIITFIIGTATIAVSYLQLENSSRASASQNRLQKSISDDQRELQKSISNNQLALQKTISDAQLTLEKLKANAAREKDVRTLQFDIARLMVEKQNEIGTEELKRVYYLREVVMSTLPKEVSMAFARGAAENATNDRARTAWLDGLVKLALNETLPSASKPPPSITADQVLRHYPTLTKVADARKRIEDILDAAKEFGVKDSASIILAYALFTSDFFKGIEEDLNFLSAEQIAAVFPNTFANASDAKPFVGDRRALANKVYSGRFGNVGPDDGWKYHGRGYLGTIGKANYMRSRDAIGIDLVTRPEMLTDSKVAAKEIAVAFVKLAQLGLPITVDGVVEQLNGRLLGLAGIQAIYEKLAPETPKVTGGLIIPAVGRSCSAWC